MARYRTKPMEFEAFQVGGPEPCPDWLLAAIYKGKICSVDGILSLREGDELMIALAGDFIAVFGADTREPLYSLLGGNGFLRAFEPVVAEPTDRGQTAAETETVRVSVSEYREGAWTITHNPKPGPAADYDWDWFHDDWEGTAGAELLDGRGPDRRRGFGSSPDDCRRQIAELEAELAAEGGQ